MKTSEYRDAVNGFVPDDGMKDRIYKKIAQRHPMKQGLLLAGAAAAVLIAALLIVPRLLTMPPGQSQPQSHASEQVAVASQAAQTDKKIVTGGDGAMDEWVPEGGQVNLSGGVSMAMADPANADALFYVCISIYCDPEQYFMYGGKTMAAWYADRLEDPVFIHREEVYQTWYTDIYLPLDAEMRDAEENGEEYAQGWEKHDTQALFDAYWEETQSEEVKAAYALSCEDLRQAQEAYSAWLESDAFGAEITQRMNDECSRLVSLGLDVQPASSGIVGRLTAYLTKAQIEKFPVSNEYGYIIMWADKDDVIDE